MILMGRILIPAVLVAAVLFSGQFVGLMQGYGLVFILLGGMALALMSFSFLEIGAAFKCASGIPGSRAETRTSGLFWEASARNFWMLGVLASVMSFVNALTSSSVSSGGIAALASKMAASLVPSVYGLVLGAVCLVPSWKLGGILCRQPLEDASPDSVRPDQKTETFWKLETVLGYALFILLAAWTIVRPFLSMPAVSFKSWSWFFYGPAVLIILGGTMAFVLFVGGAAAGTPLTASFALTALIGLLMGFTQVLLGFASKDIGRIASAMTFILSSSFLGLAGMILVGAPMEDRMVKAGKADRPTALSRVAWAIFPLVALIFLGMAFFLVITPMNK